MNHLLFTRFISSMIMSRDTNAHKGCIRESLGERGKSMDMSIYTSLPPGIRQNEDTKSKYTK